MVSSMPASMTRRTQAFRQAPWRLRIRWTSRTLLAVVVFLVVSGLYLAVNAKLARAGREVLSFESHRSELERVNGELTTDLAELTSPAVMGEKAAGLGFKPAGAGDVLYLPVDGYVPPSAFVAPRPPASDSRGQSMLSPAYTETLGEWISRWLGGWGGS
jgi:hypothetical protein